MGNVSRRPSFAFGRRGVLALVAAAAGLATLFWLAEAGGARVGDGETRRAVLAISWQPAFCEGRPRLPECRSQRPGRIDTQQFSLHGLWPQGASNSRRENYCGTRRTVGSSAPRRGGRDWSSLPGLGLDRDLARRLLAAMPGTRSFLHRHEWEKHGTCYRPAHGPRDAANYYEDSLALLDEVNASAVAALFRSNIGRPLAGPRIRKAFDDAFGAGAGRRVRIECRRDGQRRVIVELQIALAGRFGVDGMAALLRGARPVRMGCPQGIVDPVGFQ